MVKNNYPSLTGKLFALQNVE